MPPPTQFALTTSTGYKIVACEDILYCIATGNYTEVKMSDGQTVLVTKNLGSIEAKLPNTVFLRIHHGYLVNRAEIVEVLINGKCCVRMRDGKELDVASRRKTAVLSSFERI